MKDCKEFPFHCFGTETHEAVNALHRVVHISCTIASKINGTLKGVRMSQKL